MRKTPVDTEEPKQSPSKGSGNASSIEKKFWQKTVKMPSGCWHWVGQRIKGAYGRLKINGKHVIAHRLSWTLHRGVIPDGVCVLHRCDNPPCVNPDHLFLGSHADNAADKKSKGREFHPSGEINGHSKLSVGDVLEIRNALALGRVTQTDIGKLYGVSRKTINDISKRRKWTHLK